MTMSEKLKIYHWQMKHLKRLLESTEGSAAFIEEHFDLHVVPMQLGIDPIYIYFGDQRDFYLWKVDNDIDPAFAVLATEPRKLQGRRGIPCYIDSGKPWAPGREAARLVRETEDEIDYLISRYGGPIGWEDICATRT
jgi:hypothetical protein